MIPALLNFLILSLLVLIHMYWAFGGRRGANGAIPMLNGVPAFRPGVIPTLTVAAVLAGFAGLHLIHIGWLAVALPAWLHHYGLWIIAAIFLLRAIGDFRYVGFFKRPASTLFARMDSHYYSPLCILLSINAYLTTLFAQPL